MNTLLDKIRNFINVFCTNNDSYQLVSWDDGSFDVIESIYQGAIVYQFIGDGDAVIVKENGRTTVISSYDEFNQLFPYIFQ